MRDYFHQIADFLESRLLSGEIFTCGFAAEKSNFVRFNHGTVRQAGVVTQHSITLDLIEGRHHASGTLSLSGELKQDCSRIVRMIDELRKLRAEIPDDPYLLYATDPRSTERIQENRLPEPQHVLKTLLASGRGLDLVGIYAAGPIYRGFANSLGQRNWYASHSFSLEWSLYHQGDKAVKSSYAGFEWNSKEYEHKLNLAREQFGVVKEPARTIPPGRYRVYLTPRALMQVMDMLAWGGFSLRAHCTRTTPLLRMIEEGARLHPSVSIRENSRNGIAPNFQAAGFIRPDEVTLIDHGAYASCLASPRSALEYGFATNGASDAEAPLSLDMDPGNMPMDEVMERLDTGLYVSNLWYLNYSHRSACRMTGMTRFATFWVEKGRIQAPLNVMRFDDTIYRILGENLLGSTQERELILDPSTYECRSTRSARLPGVLVEDFTFTL
jgi:Predicted Zn-dependent proteases and their inactivated homologs